MIKSKERIVCAIAAMIMFFAGMCLEIMQSDSFFSCVAKDGVVSLEQVDYLVENADLSTVEMLVKPTVAVRNSNSAYSISKQSGRIIPVFLQMPETVQYVSYYQSEECKEDAQLFLCRSVAVNYIHMKDGGK